MPRASPPNPPQFDSLPAADTQLVTIGIGGNDIGRSGGRRELLGVHRPDILVRTTTVNGHESSRTDRGDR